MKFSSKNVLLDQSGDIIDNHSQIQMPTDERNVVTWVAEKRVWIRVVSRKLRIIELIERRQEFGNDILDLYRNPSKISQFFDMQVTKRKNSKDRSWFVLLNRHRTTAAYRPFFLILNSQSLNFPIQSQFDFSPQMEQTSPLPFFYYTFYVEPSPSTPPAPYLTQPYIDFLVSETMRLKQEQEALMAELGRWNEEKERISSENEQLRDEIPRGQPASRRRYRKRRTWLEKKYRCNVKGCSNKYSSKIALNCHKRKKHPKRARDSQ